MMKGTDLSSNNTYDIATNPDGYEFFLIKVSEGTDFINPDAATWIAQCKHHNRRYGVYHYFHGHGTGEAQFFMDKATFLGYEHVAGNIIPFCDVETPNQGTQGQVEAFRDVVHHKWGIVPGYYSFDSYIIEQHYTPTIANMKLWFADPSGLPVPLPWHHASIMQVGTLHNLDLDESNLTDVTVPAPPKPLWIIHTNGSVRGKTRHPKIWEFRHPRRFGAKNRRQLGFRRV